MAKFKYAIIFVILLVLGNFLRLFIEDNNQPKVEINNEISYQKNEAKKDNDLSDTKAKYDINLTSLEELLKLGFSKSKAVKIMEFRDELGLITDLEEYKGLSRFGESGLKQLKKYFFVDKEKVFSENENATGYYEGRKIKQFNIKELDEEGLKLVGFSKKEIKVLKIELEKGNIRSNIDLEKLIGVKRYEELEKRIKFY